jgi:hypothetical protein
MARNHPLLTKGVSHKQIHIMGEGLIKYGSWHGVADPDPDPPDPRVFGPPGSGSGFISQLVRGIDPDPDPSIIKQKK